MREPVSSPFTSFLAQHFDQINDYLATFFDGQATSADIERYLYAPLSAFTANAGKRHRPLICMLAATAVGGSFESARSAAAAIEHFQSGALIHDDIADNGQLRRGKPCMHLTEGTGLAINCGDLALTMVTKTVLDDPTFESDVKLRVLHELTEMIVRTIEGQALDLGWVRDGRFDISVDDYLDMATHKTAFYSGATPLAAGAIVGGGSDKQIEALRAFRFRTTCSTLSALRKPPTRTSAPTSPRASARLSPYTPSLMSATTTRSRRFFPRAPMIPRSSHTPWRSSRKPAPSITPTLTRST